MVLPLLDMKMIIGLSVSPFIYSTITLRLNSVRRNVGLRTYDARSASYLID